MPAADDDLSLQVPDNQSAVPAESHHRSMRRAAMLTVGVGFAHAALFVLAYYLVATTPGGRAPDAEIRDFYVSDARRLTLVGLYVMPFAGIAFVWFIVALRMWISLSHRRENVLLSNVQLVSGILFLAMFFASGAASAAAAASVEFAGAVVNPDLARQLPLYGSTLLLVFGMRMAAMFVFTTSSIARTTGILPRWFTYAGYAVGLFMLLSASFSPLLVLVFPAWMFTLCILLFVRARRIPVDAAFPVEARTQLPLER
jgi:hypothetical protein